MSPQTRINSIDLLRGIVMVIMALDHTRDFFHAGALTGNPLDLQTTTPALFFTRWITHLCAPTFVFLSGTSAYFQSLRKSKADLSAFLLKRGLWLILIEVLVISFAITFNVQFSFIILQVIWAIGISMFVLGLLIRLPFWVLFIIGIILVAGHNLLDYYEASHTGPFPFWYHLIHLQGTFAITPENSLLVFYPFLPWTGVMLLGYCFGRYYLHDIIRRHQRSILLGAGLLVVFIFLRWFDVYGDPLKWSYQENGFYTLMSFINTQKYPPSLLFLCITLGIALIILGVVGEAKNKFADAIMVFGRVPLFYYILHFYLIHLVAAVFYLLRGHSFEEGMTGTPGLPFNFVAVGEGYSLPVVYLVWLLIVIVLYPVCRWYSTYKIEHRSWWLSYL